MSRHFALVPAAGSGARFGAETPKQYLPLAGRPLIYHTLAALCRCARIEAVWVVLSPGDKWWSDGDWSDLGDKLCVVRCGGATRAESVTNGLGALAGSLSSEDWVLVHDAARPCLATADLDRLLAELADDPVGGLLASPVRDTLKRTDSAERVVTTVDRSRLWHALTPQMFRLGMLYDALSAALERGLLVTDEAAAMEAADFAPRLVAGRADNIKITCPEDLALAEFFLSRHTVSTAT